jgi:hypothetical protein
LKTLARKKTPAVKIARALKRKVSSVSSDFYFDTKILYNESERICNQIKASCPTISGARRKFPNHFYFRMRFRRIPKSDRTAGVSRSRTYELIDFDSLTLLPCAADVTAIGDGVGMAVASDGIIAMLRGVLG